MDKNIFFLYKFIAELGFKHLIGGNFMKFDKYHSSDMFLDKW